MSNRENVREEPSNRRRNSVTTVKSDIPQPVSILTSRANSLKSNVTSQSNHNNPTSVCNNIVDFSYTNGSNIGSDSLYQCKNSNNSTIVSFTSEDPKKQAHHRYSISSKPSKLSSANTSPNGSITDLSSPIDSLLVSNVQMRRQLMHDNTNNNVNINANANANKDTLDRNSIVNMPGDFIYFESSNMKRTDINASLKQQVFNKEKRIIKPPEEQLPFTDYFLKEDDKKIHVLIGATGSVATIKVPLIIDKLFKIFTPEKVSIQLVVTKPAEHFLRGLKLSTHVKIWREEDEWSYIKKIGDPVLHHELRKWADIFIIAPLSANTLAKMANGICNNIITLVLRSWPSTVPVIVAPAMNTFMYCNPITKKHLKMIEEDAPFITVLKPVEKVLVCGDIGMGGMREWLEIVEIARCKINEIRKAREEELGPAEEEEEEEDDEDDDDDEEEIVDQPDSEASDADDDDDDDDDEEVTKIENETIK